MYIIHGNNTYTCLKLNYSQCFKTYFLSLCLWIWPIIVHLNDTAQQEQ